MGGVTHSLIQLAAAHVHENISYMLFCQPFRKSKEEIVNCTRQLKSIPPPNLIALFILLTSKRTLIREHRLQFLSVDCGAGHAQLNPVVLQSLSNSSQSVSNLSSWPKSEQRYNLSMVLHHCKPLLQSLVVLGCSTCQS